jgi:23S rRNA (cytidine1920-2'-O)/16S rRNA (cytidine1409-2'-O)-methyltransferase
MPKRRVDILLVERGLAESRSLAQRLVMAGQVRADGQLVAKSSDQFAEGVELTVKASPRYVSRGGEKLEAALHGFAIDAAGWTCADLGASTGGFTDCLLQHGAAKVYAIDVGKGQLHWKLRQDPRVVVMEEQNARHLAALPDLVDMVTIDASFISLKTLFPTVAGWLKPDGEIVALVKPQFEAGRKEAGRGKGVIREGSIHQRVLHEVLGAAVQLGLNPAGLVRSPVLGPKGNVEFLAWIKSGEPSMGKFEELIEVLLPEDKDSSS